MRTAVVIPTYQEAMNIDTSVRRVRSFVPAADVLVVDDNSPDGTAALADGLGAELGQVCVLHRPDRLGLGPAYRAGWAWALERHYDVIVSMDADGSHDAASLPDLLAAIDSGADLAMGSRYIPGGSVPGWPLHRLALSRVGNRYASAVLGLPVHDATGGYRAYRADLLRRIDLSTLQANGYGFQIELVHRAVMLGAKVIEVPITFVDRELGESKMSASIISEALALVSWWSVRDRLFPPTGRTRRSGLRPEQGSR
ncbi:MAG: polyprenol monophosphomannose synthase [Acidimicrobiales bacterium]